MNYWIEQIYNSSKNIGVTLNQQPKFQQVWTTGWARPVATRRKVPITGIYKKFTLTRHLTPAEQEQEAPSVKNSD